MGKNQIRNKKKEKPKNKSEKEIQRRREMKKLSMRRAREKLKSDPVKYEEIKRKDKERKKASRKKISEMSDREKRKMRKGWRERAKKHREKKKEIEQTLLIVETPPESPQHHDPENRPSYSRVASGRKTRKRNREIIKKELDRLKEENMSLKRRMNKYKQKYFRAVSKNDDTPKKDVKRILSGKKVPKIIRQNLEFGAVLKKQINENFKKEVVLKKKRNLVNMITGKIIKKYRFMQKISLLTSKNLLKPKVGLRKRKYHQKEKLQNLIIMFLEKDENSRLCPGKKDTITKKKQKKQKRLLSDSLNNLHQKFMNSFPEYKDLSYSQFCRGRPFWIVSPNCQKRNTCNCTLCDNFGLVVKKMNLLGMIEEKSPNEILQRITCEKKLDFKCLDKTCEECNNNDPFQIINEYEDENIKYEQWITKRVKIDTKNGNKIKQNTCKEEITCTKHELVSKFAILIGEYRQHMANIKHQYQVINEIKKSLAEDEVFVHMDFSENYQCKYAEEIQSVHFGGSRKQVTLHTVVLYYKSEQEESLQHKSICTMSDNRRHDPVAICAHLKPVFVEIKKVLKKDLRKVHFLSDGPSTQYRNKKMFYLAATLIAKELQVESLHWHYSEKGHGKGAPDGIGGCTKRLADTIVSHGKDVQNIDALVSALKEKSSSIDIHKINSEEIEELDKQLPKKIQTFQGTLKVHEITWSKVNKMIIQVRRLSCIECTAEQTCNHFGIGKIKIDDPTFIATWKPLKVSEVYTSDEESDVEQLKNIAHNNYVVVKFISERHVEHYVGMVEKVLSHKEELIVNFMRKSTGVGKFIFPDKTNVETVDKSAIVKVLEQPEINNRNQYIFKENLESFKNMH